MNSILDEIMNIRFEKPLLLDYSNSNRYRVVVGEEDGSKTSYCFGVPIYNRTTRKMSDLKFRNAGGRITYQGSDADIVLGDDISMTNPNGICRISLSSKPILKSENTVAYDNVEIVPTLNGLAFKVPCNHGENHTFVLETECEHIEERLNNKSFSVMREKFIPFVTVSCIATLDSMGNVIAPCEIECKKFDGHRYTLSIKTNTPFGKYVLYEINLYEQKLFQDTTVESVNPNDNNAFGGTAFIGNTLSYGEQWLYSRPNFSLLGELSNTRINSVKMHMPRFNRSRVVLSASGVAYRFCSFGSNWQNKVSASSEIGDAALSDKYHSIDLTKIVTNQDSGLLVQTGGIIFKSKRKNSGFTAVSTGDNFYSPQIIEINHF